MTAPRRVRRLALVVIMGTFVVTLAGLGAGYVMFRGGPENVSAIVAIGGPFELVDHTGVRRTDADFRGRLMLVYFGYTHCPDFCPAGLQAMAAALDAAGDAAENVTPVFITVDPARDTVEVLRGYVAQFHPRLVGLTGTPEQVAAALKTYRVYAARPKELAEGGAGSPEHKDDHSPENGDGEYLMDHSVFIYLMGRDGRYVTHFRHETPAAEIAARIRKAL